MKVSYALIFIIALSLFSCTKNDDPIVEPSPIVPKTTIEFEKEYQNVLKSENELELRVVFDKAAAVAGTFSIKLTGSAIYEKHFNTIPVAEDGVIHINVVKGQTAASFKVIPLNEEGAPGNQTISLSLKDTSKDIFLGNIKASMVYLLEDIGGLATISFKDEIATISENNTEGIHIKLQLDGKVRHLESFLITVESSDGFKYGQNYTTEPSAFLQYFSIEVYPGRKDIDFKVFPKNDLMRSPNYNLKFTIYSTSEGLQIGDQNTFNLGVEEDDIINPDNLHTIADLRDFFNSYSGRFYFPRDYFIEGVVTSESNVVNDKTIYIQDATGGIMLMFTGEKLVNIGDKVQFNLKNGEGEMIDGQKTVIHVSDRAGIKLGSNFTVEPEIVTITQLQVGDFQGKRVQLQNVNFVLADGKRTFSGVYQVSDGTKVWSITTLGAANFKDHVIPQGEFTITGVVGAWNSIQPQSFRLDIVRQ